MLLTEYPPLPFLKTFSASVPLFFLFFPSNFVLMGFCETLGERGGRGFFIFYFLFPCFFVFYFFFLLIIVAALGTHFAGRERSVAGEARPNRQPDKSDRLVDRRTANRTRHFYPPPTLPLAFT